MSTLRRTSYTPHVEKHGNIYVADIPENETLLNWNANINEQTDIVKNGLRKAVVRAKQLGANEAVLRRLLAAKTGEEFYKTLENYVVPAIMHNIKGASKGFSNDMAASLLLNQAGIPGLYHANAYLDNATLKPKHNRNFVIWNTDMIKLMSISQDSDFDAKNSFIQAKKGDLKSSTKSKDAFTPRQAASLSDEAEQLLNMVEKELAHTEGNVYHQLGVFAGESLSTDTEQQIDALRKQYQGSDGWLKAPNGKQSNLGERDWLLVRTPYFKAIFGDWENNPASSSKVLDENGEPYGLPAEKISFEVSDDARLDDFKLLGLPFYEEIAEQYPDYLNLLQIDGNDDWQMQLYDMGMICFLIRPDDLKALDFSKVKVYFHSC